MGTLCNIKDLTLQLAHDPQTARERVQEALFVHDGDRQRAASRLGVSLRTLCRAIAALDLGVYNTRAVIQVLGMIRSGETDYGRISSTVYGEDTRETRQRVYCAVNRLRRQRILI